MEPPSRYQRRVFDAVWGGMSGSGAYYMKAAVAMSTRSAQLRTEYLRPVSGNQSWVDFTNNTFIPDSRGSTFDLQALDVNAVPATLEARRARRHSIIWPNQQMAAKTPRLRSRFIYQPTTTSQPSDTLLSTQTYA
jgi:hypothetical protein